MIKVCGYSDDLIEVVVKRDDHELYEEEYDSYNKDTVFEFDDGTQLRMTDQHGTWRAKVEKNGTAPIAIEPLIHNNDWSSSCSCPKNASDSYPLAFAYGVQLRYRLSNRFHLLGEVSGMTTARNFDAIGTSTRFGDNMLTATLGISLTSEIEGTLA